MPPGETSHTAARPDGRPAGQRAPFPRPPSRSYTWKALVYKGGNAEFQNLDMKLTLEENGVPDEVSDFQELHIPTDYYIPVIHLYWTDDLTVA